MKEKKDKKFILRLSKSELELLEDLANSFTKNGDSVTLAEAIRMSLKMAKSYLKKSNLYRPIKRIEQINKENEDKVKLENKYGIDYNELLEIANLDWLEE